ncbi:hypothetical protein [Tenggerimyces flavus]|uniref:Uncharacterized protein n=1 Tax=Tenggerimyces flavus TaxID=1708749 RepID=A0ABV7YDW3_9ACTN|nr:hypothetical protein [Tenggerimyces flavus]MBM7784259.1 hypothetical protein [Tenggerimyces flavus]
MNDQPTVIENVAFLDLSQATPENLARLEEIRGVATLVVPADGGELLTRVRLVDVAHVIPVPRDAHVRFHTGMFTLSGEALADPGGDNEVLVVIGGLVVTTPVERVGYREVVVIGAVLAPRGSETALGIGLTRVTGAVNYYTYVQGQRFQPLSGEIRISGETLANHGGNAGDVLMLAGDVIITSLAPRVGFQEVFWGGRLLAPRSSEGVLAPRLVGGGELIWYGGEPRFFKGQETFGRGFFDALDGPVALALVGDFRIESDVPAELLRAKVSEVTLVGNLSARKELVSALQVLTTEKYGNLVVSDGHGDA